MTPITRESARLAVSELPAAGGEPLDIWPLSDMALEQLSAWLDERLVELEDRYNGYRTRSSVRNAILGQDRSRHR
jgi:hypothetical protein